LSDHFSPPKLFSFRAPPTDESDLDGLAARLNALGITDDSPQDATSLRILPLVDPDGNRVVFTGAFT
jgi:hypothetical protein